MVACWICLGLGLGLSKFFGTMLKFRIWLFKDIDCRTVVRVYVTRLHKTANKLHVVVDSSNSIKVVVIRIV